MELMPWLLDGAWLAGRMLLHSLWQGALVGLGYAVVRSGLPRGDQRYRLGLIALGGLLACQLSTLVVLLGEMVPGGDAGSSMALALPDVASLGHGQAHALVQEGGLDAWLNWLVLAWLLGVSALSVRAWREWRGLKALVRQAEPAPEWQQRVCRLAGRFQLRRRIRVLYTRAVATPILVGVVRPVILLPMAVACQLPVAQVELILAHELAHLRRLDPLVNLFQFIIETLYFHQPIVRWISREVRNEREVCCDAMALTLVDGNRRDYVSALAELAELNERHGALPLASGGGVLLDRIQLIATAGQRTRKAQSHSSALVPTLAMAVALTIVWQIHMRAVLSSAESTLSSLAWPHLLPENVGFSAAGDGRFADLVAVHVQVMRPVVGLDQDAAESIPDIDVARMGVSATVPHIMPMAVPAMTPDRNVVLVPAVVARQPLIPAPAPAMPVPVRVTAPTYPKAALERGIEGHVELEFGLDARGNVRDIQVLDATPAGVFDYAAEQALDSWKFAAPAGGAHQRYRQTLTFVLPGSTKGRVLKNTIQARAGCQTVTGTLICRRPDGQ